MIYDFDTNIPRENTQSVKWDLRKEIFGKEDVIPMWVADMDFPTPDFIVDAMKKRMEHPIFGYSFRPDSYYQSIINWQRKRHQWDIEQDWIIFTPGVVPAINIAVLAYTLPGEKVIFQPPVYFPFFEAIKNNGRTMVANPLHFDGKQFRIDFDDLKRKLDDKTRLLLLSNPHNPGGMVWDKDDLSRLASICKEHNILILSDEIHCDLLNSGYKHIPLASLSPEIADITITAIAPSKTFNLAGLSTSSVIISNNRLRQSYKLATDVLHIGGGNIFGAIASEAAYTHGEEWLNQLMKYLESNMLYAAEYIDQQCHPLKFIKPQATYLGLIDCRDLDLSTTDLKTFFINEVGLGLNDGAAFGEGGDGFMRLNFACPRQRLDEALERLKMAVRNFIANKKIEEEEE